MIAEGSGMECHIVAFGNMDDLQIGNREEKGESMEQRQTSRIASQEKLSKMSLEELLYYVLVGDGRVVK